MAGCINSSRALAYWTALSPNTAALSPKFPSTQDTSPRNDVRKLINACKLQGKMQAQCKLLHQHLTEWQPFRRSLGPPGILPNRVKHNTNAQCGYFHGVNL